MDPIIEGLFERLPATGENWPEQDRRQWLTMLEQAFKVIYEDDTAGGTTDPNYRHPISGQ